jgi:hypothetical protein
MTCDDFLAPTTSQSCCASSSSTTTPTAPTDHSVSTRPQAALPRPPERPSDRYDATASAASYTSIWRSHDVTEFSAPTTSMAAPHAAGAAALLLGAEPG